jgi:peptidoglycan DL-endopeptidase LytF
MTRRDIIIVAVLINAGLLAVLFMMAINTDEEKVSDPIEITQMATEANPVEQSQEGGQVPITVVPITGDEGDNALQAFESSGIQSTEFTKASQAQDELVQDLDQDDDLPPANTEQPKATIPEATSAPTENSKPTSKTIEVTVKRGDSLDKIARANGTTIKALKEANHLKSDRLDIGQILKVPVATKKSATIAKSTKTAPSQLAAGDDPQYYTVKNGDNPWKIAKKFNVKVDELLKLNNLNEEKARNLKVGDKIRVR